jgi:eukaryotic-like serine/threonine-protein kinase
MNPERWGQIKQIYHSALGLEPGRREAFLKEACAGDEALFKEVASLLAQEGNSGNLLEAPALDVVARALGEDEADMPHEDLAGHNVLHYRIEKKIGEGGMGEVFLAQDTSLNRKVALKFLPPEMQQDPVARKRFFREARSAAALDNPYICSIHEVGEFEGKDFIVMEYVDGQTLMEKLRRGRLSLSQSLQIATETAEALQAAHGKGIIHRDLKPSNIMLTKTGHAKVMDFGLAKQIVPSGGIDSREDTVSAMTRSGMTLGTLAYMSPEQLRGEAVDARSDIFSFGLVLYEMLTRTHPFRKESPMETASGILHEEPKPVGAIMPAIPADLEKLINHCLRKEAERRIQHMDDVKLALIDLKGDLDSGRLQVAPDARKRVSPVGLAIAMAAVLVLIATGWYWLGRHRSSEPEGPLTAVPLTTYPGTETFPSFSPDGTQVAFQWCPEDPGQN